MITHRNTLADYIKFACEEIRLFFWRTRCHLLIASSASRPSPSPAS
jgi:hypothetical protein